MAVTATIVVTATLLENDHLFTARLRNDLGRDREAVGRLGFTVLAREQDVGERHGFAGLASELLDDDLVSGGDAILLAARAHDSEHGSLFKSRPDARNGAVGPTAPRGKPAR